MSPPNRRLATVLFTDIVGSTTRASEIGDRAWRELLERHHSLVRDRLERFRGREVNTAGDGFIAVFDDPELAIRCACEIRDAVCELGIAVRCGIHTGEVTGSEDDVGGIAVHIAARVMSEAGAAEVVVSSTVRDLVTGSELAFDDLGPHDLRGVPGVWRLHSVTGGTGRLSRRRGAGLARRLRRMPGVVRFSAGAVVVFLPLALAMTLVMRRGDSSPFLPRVAVAGIASPGIAVLPFAIRGAGLEDGWREGMVDLLSTGLDGVAGLRAIDSRTVLARWHEHVRGGDPDLQTALQVGRATGARYVLVGSAVRIGERVRLSADVYDLVTKDKVGPGETTGSPDSVLLLADRLSIAVLREMLGGGERELPPLDFGRVTTDSLDALRAFLRGEVSFRRSDFQQAFQEYRQAVEIDSTFALALYRLGTALAWKDEFDEDTEAYLARAARLASRLTTRDALLVRGSLALNRGSLDGLAHLKRATREYPDDAEAWFWLGETYFHLGPQALARPDQSEDAFSRVVELDPSFTPAYLHLIQSALNQHADSSQAARLIERYDELSGSGRALRPLRLAFDLAFGDSATHDRAKAALDSLDGEQRLMTAAYLWSPRYRDLHEEVLQSALRAGARDSLITPLLETMVAFSYLSRGQLRQFLTFLHNSQWRGPGVYTAYTMGLPVSASQLARELRLADGDPQPGSKAFCAAAYAADTGAWSEHARRLEQLQESAERLLAEGDSTDAEITRGMEQALQAYALWRQGRGAEAAPMLKDAQRRATGLKWGRAQVNALIRFWLGKVLLETGQPAEAERYLAARENELQYEWLWQDPIRELYLGQIYEKLEQPERARQAYSAFAEGWAGADPEVQPLVQKARRKAEQLATRSD